MCSNSFKNTFPLEAVKMLLCSRIQEKYANRPTQQTNQLLTTLKDLDTF